MKVAAFFIFARGFPLEPVRNRLSTFMNDISGRNWCAATALTSCTSSSAFSRVRVPSKWGFRPSLNQSPFGRGERYRFDLSISSYKIRQVRMGKDVWIPQLIANRHRVSNRYQIDWPYPGQSSPPDTQHATRASRTVDRSNRSPHRYLAQHQARISSRRSHLNLPLSLQELL